MKLYTEEQVRKAINHGSLYSYINGNFKFKNSEDDIINALTPIQLPTDEEIKEGLFHHSNEYAIGFKDAIEYIKQQYK